MPGEFIIDSELANDPNYQAYIKMESEGSFADLEPGTFVAFAHGALIAINADRDTVLQEARSKVGAEAIFFNQVNIEKPVLHIRGPRIVKDQE